MNLEHFVELEGKKILKSQKDGAWQKDTGGNLKEPSNDQSWISLNNKINNTVLDYNPK